MPMTSKQETSDRHADEPLIGDIEDAARRLAGVAVITPLLESAALNERLGGRLLVKAEPLQRTGSFKFRGAYNFMSRLGAAARRCGVMTYSSGNHGQAVAAAAKLLGMPALILMPTDAPAIKVRNTKAYGAEVMHYDRYADDRERLGAALVAERGYTLVPPFDHGLIIAGQGTTGLEIAEQAAHIGAEPDAVLVCCGGGGLVAGVALALADRMPKAAVYAVEPRDFDDTRRSLTSGVRQSNDAAARSICDSLQSPTPGALTFPINRRLLAGGLAVSDDEARQAMAIAFADFKLVLEPGGAVALAAVVTDKIAIADRTVVVVCSGGNVDSELFISALASRV
jgi:threonine dehydratase